MEEEARPVRAGSTIAAGLAAVFKAPYRTLVGIGLLLAAVSDGLRMGTGPLVAAIALFVIDVYVQIALTLAAAAPATDPSADVWVKRSLRSRCFVRFFATGILATVLVLLAGLGGLIVGGIIVGGWLALAQPAAALERRLPIDALRRSVELARGAAVALGLVFFLLIALPSAVVQAGYYLHWDEEVGGALWMAILLVSVVASGAGTIGLTRAFVALGGSPAIVIDAPGDVSNGSH